MVSLPFPPRSQPKTSTSTGVPRWNVAPLSGVTKPTRGCGRQIVSGGQSQGLGGKVTPPLRASVITRGASPTTVGPPMPSDPVLTHADAAPTNRNRNPSNTIRDERRMRCSTVARGSGRTCRAGSRMHRLVVMTRNPADFLITPRCGTGTPVGRGSPAPGSGASRFPEVAGGDPARPSAMAPGLQASSRRGCR